MSPSAEDARSKCCAVRGSLLRGASKGVIMLKEVLGVLPPMSDVRNLMKRLRLAATGPLSWKVKIPFPFPISKGILWGGCVYFKLYKLDAIRYCIEVLILNGKEHNLNHFINLNSHFNLLQRTKQLWTFYYNMSSTCWFNAGCNMESFIKSILDNQALEGLCFLRSLSYSSCQTWI